MMSEQINRVDIPFTNEHFISFCEKMLGQPYWYGCCLYKATENLLTRKRSQYPSSYAASRMNGYRKDIAANKIVADCIGAAKGYAWTNGGQGVVESIGTNTTFTNKYGSNGCPDKGANSMFTYAKQKGMAWGAIDTLPETVGLALYKSGHVGYYVGGGYAFEWKGFAYGCVKTKLAGRGWTHWYRLPFIQYGENVAPVSPDTKDSPTYDFGTRLLHYKKGHTMLKGEDVLSVQARLTELGFDAGKADGIYGPRTATAVSTFQATTGIQGDGIVGPITRNRLAQ